jgi:hypothetical protein
MARLSDPITPCPAGRLPLSHAFQAINCLATFIQSLWDKNLPETCRRKCRRLAEPNFEDEDDDEDENEVLGVINR